MAKQAAKTRHTKPLISRPADRTELQEFVQLHILGQRLRELSQNIAVSKSRLSRYAAGKYPKPESVEVILRPYYARQRMSFRDRKRLERVEEILSESDNRNIIVEALTISFGK